MPYRKTIFSNDQVYHVLNRGVNKMPIFSHLRDYKRFIDILDFSRFDTCMRPSHFDRLAPKKQSEIYDNLCKNHSKFVKILAFSLMPNHFHLLLEQIQKNGIQIFMRNFQNSYAKYFNVKYKRSGPLFQSTFKSIDVETDEQLSHVSRYIHLNPVSSRLIALKDLDHYEFSSFRDYSFPETSRPFISAEIISNLFKNKNDYEDFVSYNAKYQQELETVKHLSLEEA